MMPHEKSFLYGLSGTVKGRLGFAGEEMQTICQHVERIIASTNWLKDADFDTIHYVMRFGEEKDTSIHCRKRPRYQELEVASQESMASLHKVFLDRTKLRRFLAVELIRVLDFVRTKHNLPANGLLFDFLEVYAGGAGQSDARTSPIDRDFEP